MNRSETAKLLAKAALIDNRTIDRATVEAWHEAIGHQDYEDAMGALFRHRQTSTDWLEPAHINSLVPAIRRERMRDGLVEQAKRALPPPPVEGPPEWFRAEAGMGLRPKPPAIKCPWCGAAPSEPCTVRGSGRPMRKLHPVRLGEIDGDKDIETYLKETGAR